MVVGKDVFLSKGAMAAAMATVTGGIGYGIYCQRHSLTELLWSRQLTNIVHNTKPRIVIVKDNNQWLAVEKELKSCCSSLGCIGFDCEWVASRPIALMQLATHTGLCVLVRLSHMKEVPVGLKDILLDPSVYKVGVGPSEDCKKLFSNHGIIVNGALDLRNFFHTPSYLMKKDKTTKKSKKAEAVSVKNDINDARQNNNYNAEKNPEIIDQISDCNDPLSTSSVIPANNLNHFDHIPSDDIIVTDSNNFTNVSSMSKSNGDPNCTDCMSSEKKSAPVRCNCGKLSSTEKNSSPWYKITPGINAPNKLGLSALADYYLDRTLDKDWRVRASDWEVPKLTLRQVKYAAEDARCGLHIMLMLLKHLNVCSCSAASLTTVGMMLMPTCRWSDVTKSMLMTVAGKRTQDSPKGGWDTAVLKKYNSKDQSGGNKTNKGYRRAYSLRKTPLYHNSLLWAPDNEPLCTVDPKKAMWYVNNNLGEIVQEEPFIVRLKFEPTGRPQKEGEDGYFYLRERLNNCVVCGKDESYIRKNVVPHEYRKNFPEILKSHQNHDVVLLCTECHQLSNQRDSVLRYQLAEEHEAPIGNASDVKVKVDGDLKVIKSAGKALQRNMDKMPAERVKELQEILRKFFETDELTTEMIIKAANLDVKLVNATYEPHGLRVYKYYEKKGVIQFEKLWRQYFLDTMKPQHMPVGWSVEHNHAKLKMKMSRHPLDDPAREQFRIALVGSEGTIDVPHVPQIQRKRQTVPSKSAAEISSNSTEQSPSHSTELSPSDSAEQSSESQEEEEEEEEEEEDYSNLN